MDDNYLKGCYLLFCVPELYLLFFQISGNLASFRGCSNIILKVKVNDALQILIIFNDILSQPWVLARSKFFIFNDMSSYAKWNHVILALVLHENNGNALKFFINVHFDAKKVIKKICFFTKIKDKFTINK